jgi:hypothetical protein
MVGGSLRLLRLLPPLKLVVMIYPVAEILLKVALNTKNQNQINHNDKNKDGGNTFTFLRKSTVFKLFKYPSCIYHVYLVPSPSQSIYSLTNAHRINHSFYVLK